MKNAQCEIQFKYEHKTNKLNTNFVICTFLMLLRNTQAIERTMLRVFYEIESEMRRYVEEQIPAVQPSELPN